jgi:protein O-mannosyl-transferase
MRAKSKTVKTTTPTSSVSSSKQKKISVQPIFNKRWAVFIFLFAFVLYANTIKNDYALDDDIVLVKNSDVQLGIRGIKNILSHSFIYGFTGHNDQSYRPLVLITYAIEKEFFPNNPHISHFINVMLFALSCLFLYRLMNTIFSEKQYSTVSIYFALVTTLLFAAHPIHTEAVANVKGRDDIMNFLFFELATLFMFFYADENKTRHLFTSALFVFLGLLSKEIAVTFVASIPLAVLFFRKTTFKKLAAMAIPLAGSLVVYLVIRHAVLDAVTFSEKMQKINNALVAADNPYDQVATAIFILWKYVGLLFFPHPLSWDYSFNQLPIVSFSTIEVGIVVVLFVSVLLMSIVSAIKQLVGSNGSTLPVQTKILAFSSLFFFVTLSVVSNIFILIGSTLGERFLLIPSFAFCLCVAAIFFTSHKNPVKQWQGGAVALLLILYSFKTITRNSEWKNNYSLFLSGVKACPNSSRAQSALGSSYREMAEKELTSFQKENLYNQAILQYKKAIAIMPDNTEALYNLGVCYYSTGDNANARMAYAKVLSIAPEYTNASNNLGVLYFELKDYENAKTYFEQALKYAPTNSEALTNLGAVHHNTGNVSLAKEYYQKALAINPNHINARNNLNKIEQP